MKKIGIYPGCCFQGADIHNYDITVDFLNRMGVEGILLDRAACCGGGVIDETNKKNCLRIKCKKYRFSGRKRC